MAITKIHAIKRTIDKSIKYICAPFKTNDSSLLTFINCGSGTADLDFKYDLKQANRDGKNLAYHLIQSFAPGEVSEDEAHQIGEELANGILHSKYTCVIATHNDKGHIHNHIIFCAVDSIDHNRYHDCKESYREIRRVNDRLCKEHNLSVVETKEDILKKSHSYAEWRAKKEGNSWKEKLRIDIKECLEFCPDYNTFLKRMNDKGYEIKNADPSEGKYILFKAPGAEKWTRGRETTLGKEFTRESIIATIDAYAHNKSTKTENKIIRNINQDNTGKILKSIDTSDPKFQEKAFLKVWANRENLKRLAHNYTLLHNKGFDKISDLEAKITASQDASDELRYKAVSLDHELQALSSTIKNMEKYLELKPFHEKYRSAKNKEAVFQKYEYEILLFDGARKSLKDEDVLLRNVTPDSLEAAKDKYHKLLHDKSQLIDEASNHEKEAAELRKLLDEINKNLEHNQEQEHDEKQKKKEKHL